jgi:hypothetical protein
MSLNTNFNVNPYFDDFDEDKKFLRILFKPGFAVQARELTQSQTLLQKQVERFGNHIFKNGSVVSGGQLFIHDTTYLNVASDFAGTAVNINNFNGKTITNLAGTKTGQVIVVADADAGTGDPKTIYVKQISGTDFAAGDTITTVEAAPAFANVSIGGVGTGQVFSVNEGVFFYDGFFLKNSAQSIAISKYDVTSNVKVGFEITESIDVYTQDTSLLDPAQDASNFQAPGADRFKIDLILTSRPANSVDDTQFIELSRVEEGTLSYAVIYPQYAVLEDTLARRTYDESGNYTIRPFKIALETSAANTAKANVIISPGKAYVYGYEYESIAPTTITFDKPRTADSVSNKRLTADYGYYVYSNTHFGNFPINNLETIDLHCVRNASINITSAATVTNTKIGTARVKSIAFDSASDSANSATYEYRTYLFDVNVSSITGGNVVALGTNTSHVQIANSITGSQLYSTANSAYTGAKFRVITGPGTGESPKTILNYNGATQTLELSEPFITSPTASSNWSIDFEFNDVKSLLTTSGATRIASADIDNSSQDPASQFNDTFISDTNLEPLLFNLGQRSIAQNTIADFSYSYKRLYENQSFGSSQSPALSVGTGESIASATSTSAKAENYTIVVTSQGGGAYGVGQTVPVTAITSVDTVLRKITITNANSMIANIIATIDASNPGSKAKTYVEANNAIQTSGGTSIFANNGVILYTTEGQVHIMANTVVKTPDSIQSLFVPDVIELVSILDFKGNQITVANSATASNVTGSYVLNTGQKDSFYDHSFIKLKSGFSAPSGPLVVKFNRFSSAGAGFFTVDSYVGFDYGNIPPFTSQSVGQIFELKDCLDFRPVRSIPTSPATANTVSFDVDSTTTGPKIPENGSDIILDYQYFLPRIDKVILNKNRFFEVIQGEPSLAPVPPLDKDGAMTLYILRERPFVANMDDIDVEYIDNRRYTMRDIGNIDRRVGNLEYYTSLSLLEQSALNKQDLTTLDSTNLPRFKNGILVDAFNGTSVADVTNRDYLVSVDTKRKEIRPTFNISSHLLTFDSANSSNYLKAGPIVLPTASHTVFVDQNKSSRIYNVNPFNIVNYIGKIQLDPPSDVWIDTNKQPDVLVNLEGDKDAWALISENAYNYDWGNWETFWTGTAGITSIRGEGGWINNQPNLGGVWNGQGGGGGAGAAWIQTTRTTTTSAQTRSGTFSRVVPSTITQSLGNRVVDVSVIPYMRNRNVLFTCSDFKPDTQLFGFFDNISVNKYIARANKFTLSSNNLGYITQSGNAEKVNVTNTATSTVNATAFIVRTSNREAFVVNLSPSTLLNGATMNLVGQSSGTTIKINGYDHYSGFVSSSTINTIVLAVDAASANNTGDYAGSIVNIVSGTGAGQTFSISSYNPATRTLTIVGTWTTTPTTSSVYSIGNLTTTAAGDVAGVFNIPNGEFRIGEKNFRLIDTSSGDIGASSTNGDATFFAQGLLQKTENTIISATVPTIQRQAVTDNRVIETTSQAEVVVGWYDPLAQTFLVSPTNYPQGIFLSKARFCFKSKDPTVPVTLQVRPVVNGYPSTSVIYPYSTVTLTPDKVNTTSSPDLDNATKYTEFVFDSPLFLQPGEHCFVLVSNSNKYEAYAAEIGKLDTVSGRQISDQPYQGSLFLSQNGSTWTAEQNSDLMFRLFRYTFSTNPTQARFNINHPAANTVFDLMHLLSEGVSVENTSITYRFNSQISGSGLNTGLLPFTPLTDYPMTDGFGRRVLNPTTGNTTFIVNATMATSNPDIAPFIDTSRMSMIAVENIINNLPLSNSDIVISNGGTGYSTNANAVVTITGGGGSGATASAVVTNNVVTSVFLTNAGSGYETSPTITIVDANTTPGTGVTVTYNGEDKKSGGNANVRYITRKVNLADGFDSGDLRVYLTAYRPPGSNIRVYFKVLSISDPDIFEEKNYQLMTQLNNTNFVSNDYNDYREFSFSPGVAGTANNSISYTSGTTSFSNFRTFAIKIVLSGESTTDVPKVRDFRATALPAGS